MKKVILSVLIILFLGGIVYLGFIVFDSKSVKNVELVGNVQTLYMVGEDLDFEDAKLKVTYKNGDVKMVKLKNADVKVNLFSTSLEKHGTMQIVYKTHTLKIDYNVLKTGLYYIRNTTTVTRDQYGQTVTTGAGDIVDVSTAREYFYLGADGVLDYYKNVGTQAKPKWLMFDGSYEDDYSYYTTGDKLVIKAGVKEFEIKAEYNQNGSLAVKSEIKTYSGDGLWLNKIQTYTFKQSDLLKANRGFNDTPIIDLSYANPVLNEDEDPGNKNDDYKVLFNVGETIKSSGKEIYIEIHITTDPFLPTVYVHLTDKMVTRKSLVTSQVQDVTFAYMFYESSDPFFLYYEVVD